MRWVHETRAARSNRIDKAWDATRKTAEEQQKALKEWHRVFAYRPKSTADEGMKMWFEYVLRRKHSQRMGAFHRIVPIWEYRPITILEKDLGTTGD